MSADLNTNGVTVKPPIDAYAPANDIEDKAAVEIPIVSHVGVDDIFAPLGPIPWVCEGLRLAKRGRVALLAGYGFSGKTMVAQHIALCMATGRPVFGVHAITQGRVLHLDYEQGPFLTKRRYQRLAAGMGITPEDIGDRLRLANFPDVMIDNANALEVFAQLFEGFDLVILDPYRAAAPATDENSSEARIPLDMLAKASSLTSSAPLPLIIDHARKPTEDKAAGGRMSIRGSGAKYDGASTVFVFDAEPNEPINVQNEKENWTGRTVADFALQIVDVEIDGVRDAGVRVELFGQEELAARAAATRERASKKVERSIAAYLANLPAQTFIGNREALRDAMGSNASQQAVAVRDMLARHELEIVPADKKTDTPMQIKLTAKASPVPAMDDELFANV